MISLIKSPFFNEEETRRSLAEFVLTTEWFSMNKECKKFENSFAEKQGRKYAVFVNSGSMANLILIQAALNCGLLKKGDKVGFSALTWATNVMPILQLGLVPVPLDSNPETLNVSPDILEKSAPELKGLFLTNVLGFSDDLKNINEICNKHNIVLFEDNCESLGSSVGGIKLGNFGLASTFSFFLGHHLSTIEGGMIATDDKDLHQALVMARAHGWDRNLAFEEQKAWRKKYGVNDFYAKYTFYNPAFNARPTELNGFIGNMQIKYWDEIVNKRQNFFECWQEEVENNPDLIALRVSHMDVVSNFAMPVIARTKELRDLYVERFVSAEVEIRPIIAGNITRQPFYRSAGLEEINLPKTDSIDKNGFYFGNNPNLTNEEVEFLASLLKK